MKAATLASSLILVYLALLCLTPASYVSPGLGMSMDRIVLVVGVSLIVVSILLTKSRMKSPLTVSAHTIALIVPLLGIFAAGAFSLLMSPDVFDKQLSLKSLLLSVSTLSFAIYLADKASVLGSPSKLLGRVSLVMAFASVVGVVLTLGQMTPLDITRALGIEPAESDIAARLLDLHDVRFFGVSRSQGFFSHPIEYGALLVLTYAVIRARTDVIKQKYIRSVVYCLLLLGGFLSGSLGAWLGFVLAELLIRFSRFKRPDRIIFATLFAISTLGFIYLSLDYVISYASNVSVNSDWLTATLAARLVDYEIVFRTLQHNPFGVGYEGWVHYAQNYHWSVEYHYLDNDYLRFLAEAGIFGLLAYLAWVFRVFLPLTYASSLKPDRSVAYILTGLYAWQAITFDAFAFQAYSVVCAILITISLRLRRQGYENSGYTH